MSFPRTLYYLTISVIERGVSSTLARRSTELAIAAICSIVYTLAPTLEHFLVISSKKKFKNTISCRLISDAHEQYQEYQ